MSTSPKHTISNSLVGSSVVGSNLRFGSDSTTTTTSATERPPKKTKLPEGATVKHSYVEGAYYTDAISVGGFLVELSNAPPPAESQPIVVQEVEQDRPLRLQSDIGSIVRGLVKKTTDEIGAFDIGSFVREAVASRHAPVISSDEPPPAAATAVAAASIVPSVTSSDLNCPTASQASGVFGLPDGARIQSSMLGTKKYKDAIVVDGRFVEISELSESDAKEAGSARVFVLDSVIESGNEILGEWPLKRRIKDAHVIGAENRIYDSVDTCHITGSKNTVRKSATNLRVWGSGNEFCLKALNSTVHGSDNNINASFQSSNVKGSNNRVSKQCVDSKITGHFNTFKGGLTRTVVEGDGNHFGGAVIGSTIQNGGNSFGGRRR